MPPIFRRIGPTLLSTKQWVKNYYFLYSIQHESDLSWSILCSHVCGPWWKERKSMSLSIRSEGGSRLHLVQPISIQHSKNYTVKFQSCQECRSDWNAMFGAVWPSIFYHYHNYMSCKDCKREISAFCNINTVHFAAFFPCSERPTSRGAFVEFRLAVSEIPPF